ncbi:MFS transporter [Pseudomonas oryzihabitans]|uniref:MFS transporter n=1 Tax=Pseudomonas oryzihabitans TaxID=47885 RepID=UPI002865A3E2|nr:MFS transporter [Pseudomonas psychrotolerans]MDR6677394.1 EmrB/QacA subfamily drug resistance transporter [Pseudomonas psychrotolerans]
MERWKILASLVSFTFFMENLDATVIATALPQMAATFGRDAVDLNLGISAYLLAIAVGIPVSGWIAERFGPRPVFTLAIGLFTLASLLCGLAQSLEQFIAARVLQGLGGALMVPVGRLVVLQVTEKHELVRAIALITWPGLVAPVLGPPLGGLITTYADWRWIFYLNLPLGLIALVLAWRLVPTTLPTRRHPLDWQGFLLLGGACVAFMWGVERLGQNHGSLGSNLAWMGVGLILGTKAVRHMARIERPLIDFGTLRIPTYRASILGGGLFRVTIATAPFLLPLMFQLAFGLDAFQAGLLLLALFAGNLAAKPFTTAAMRRFGLRRILTVNGLLSALSLLACGLLTPAWPLPLVAILLFASGLFRSLQFTASNTLAFADVPKTQLSHASTLFSTNFQLAMGLGVAVAALLLRASMEWHGHLDPQLSDFRLAFCIVAVLGILSTLDAFRLARNAGASVSGHTAKS